VGLSWVGGFGFDSAVGGCAPPGETYVMKATMKVAEMKPYKLALEAMRARLRGDVSTMADAALRKTRSEANGDLSSMPIHMADIGTDAYEQEFTLALMACEEGTLEQVEEALGRIRSKTYGICEECDGVIAKKRLEAIPFAPMCIRCAEKMEDGNGGRPRYPR
jgi:DnaK suppressor protein